MTNRDACVLGLLALAYWYLDSKPDAAPHLRVAAGDPPASLPGARAPAPACPRRAWHPVSLRADGAMWCRVCDQGYFPRVAEWDAALDGVAA